MISSEGWHEYKRLIILTIEFKYFSQCLGNLVTFPKVDLKFKNLIDFENVSKLLNCIGHVAIQNNQSQKSLSTPLFIQTVNGTPIIHSSITRAKLNVFDRYPVVYYRSVLLFSSSLSCLSCIVKYLVYNDDFMYPIHFHFELLYDYVICIYLIHRLCSGSLWIHLDSFGIILDVFVTTGLVTSSIFPVELWYFLL